MTWRKPYLSILVPTTAARRAFHPWLAWNIRKQVFVQQAGPGDVEVIVAFPAADEDDVKLDDTGCDVRRIRYNNPELPLPLIRQGLLLRARGEFVAWFDDDDWHHPNRLRDLLDLEPRHWAGCAGLSYLDIAPKGGVVMLANYRTKVVPMTMVGRREHLSEVPFNPHKLRGSDTEWFDRLKMHFGTGGDAIETGPLPYFFALAHGKNMHNDVLGRLRFGDSPDRWVHAPGWGDTGRRLRELRDRLGIATCPACGGDGVALASVFGPAHKLFEPCAAGCTPIAPWRGGG